MSRGKKIFFSFCGLLFILLACFFVVAFLSYNPLDIYAKKHNVIINQGGSIGFKTADFCLQYFGVSAVLIPFFLAIWGLILFYNHHLQSVVLKLFLGIFSLFGFSYILGSFHNIENAFSFMIGGYIGWMLNSFTENSVMHLPVYAITLFFLPILVFFASGLKDFLIPVKIYTVLMNLVNNFIKRANIVTDAENSDIKNINDEIAKAKALPKKMLPQNKNMIDESGVVSKMVKPLSGKYIPPEISFFAKNSSENQTKHNESVRDAKNLQEKLKKALLDFGVEGEIVSFTVGPVITMYEFEPKPGIRSSRIIGLSDDIARSLKAKSARISILPSKSSLAIEIPNDNREIIYIREIIESESFKSEKNIIPLCLGKDISGGAVVVDLTKMPHLLVAGTTGSGKSIGINTMIMSIIYRLSPEECKIIMIDPKMLELSVYEGIPHLMTPVVTDPEKAALTLQWVTKEMERRYKVMSKIGVRNIFNYNSAVEERKDANKLDARFTESQSKDDDGKKMPYIVVIVDEMADLMLTAGKTVEASIQRLAQMARAAGIHIIMATQRPSVDVITGIIKANFPTRISFQVTSKIDSRTILGYQGAEALLGKGDMLYMPTGGKTYRIHGPFVDDKEVGKVVTYLKQNYPNTDPSYGKISLEIEKSINSDSDDGEESSGNDDDLYSQAVAIVRAEKRASISYIQRRLRIGYNKAANFIEQMEDEGIVSAPDSQGKRIVIDGK